MAAWVCEFYVLVLKVSLIRIPARPCNILYIIANTALRVSLAMPAPSHIPRTRVLIDESRWFPKVESKNEILKNVPAL